MSTYETPEIIELGTIADFTRGQGLQFNYDGGLDFWGTQKPGSGGS